MTITKAMLRITALVLLLLFLVGCSKNFDENTGTYKGGGVVITFPKGWKKTKTVLNAAITVIDPGGVAEMSLFIQKAPKDVATLEDFLRIVSERTRGVKGVKEEDMGTVTIDGLQGRWIRKAITVKGKDFDTIMYYVMKDRKIYSLLGITEAESFARWAPVFKKVAEGMRFSSSH